MISLVPPHAYPTHHCPWPLTSLCRIGAIIALVGSEQVNRNVNNFNQELSNVIGDLREYVNTSIFVSDCHCLYR